MPEVAGLLSAIWRAYKEQIVKDPVDLPITPCKYLKPGEVLLVPELGGRWVRHVLGLTVGLRQARVTAGPVLAQAPGPGLHSAPLPPAHLALEAVHLAQVGFVLLDLFPFLLLLLGLAPFDGLILVLLRLPPTGTCAPLLLLLETGIVF